MSFYIYRGQESAGIVTSDGNSVPTYRTHKVYLNIKKVDYKGNNSQMLTNL